MPVSRMNALDAIMFGFEILSVLKNANAFQVGEDGHFKFVLNANEIEAIAPAIEAILTKHGFVIPVQVNAILNALPLVLQIAGIK